MNNVVNEVDKIDKEFLISKIREGVLKKLSEYEKSIKYMSGDAPISILCLPKQIETPLLNHGLNRVYDLFDCDFTEVKGLGVGRIKRLTACLDEFLTMC